jgi:hypothetical protein
MIYLLVLLEQIVLYHVVGLAAHKGMTRYMRLQSSAAFFTTQFLGILLVTMLQFCLFLSPFPKNHASMVLLAAGASTLLFFAAQSRPRFSDIRPSISLPRSYSDIAFVALLLPLVVFWLCLAITTGYNMVPKGDGWTWVVKATYWAFHAPLDIAGSPFSAYPPASTLVEAFNLLLIGRPEPNCALLAMWWLHIVSLGLIFSLARKATNRWGALLLIGLLTFSQDFVFNVTLGYRDALMMKLVAATSLAAIQLTRTPRDRGTALLLGLLVSATATLKDEGLIYAAICLFPMSCALLRQYKLKRMRELMVDLLPVILPPIIIVASWWAIRLNCGMKGFQGQTPSPSDILAGLTAARIKLIANSMWVSLKSPIFGIAILATPLACFKATSKTVIQPLLSAILCLLFITFIYVSTTVNVEWHIQTSMSRLMFAPYAMAAVFAVLVSMGWLSTEKSESE